MKVSVIIPTYNRAHYLRHAIDSVLAQTYSDLELIVIDDGSTDNTKSVVESYKNSIVYRYINNSGPAIARNTGMQLAQGEYIAYLDSDDIYYPRKIEIQVAFLDFFKEADMVYTEFSGFNDTGFFEYRHLKNYHKSAYRTGSISYEEMFSSKHLVQEFCKIDEWNEEAAYLGDIFESYLYNTVVFTNSMMFRKSLLSKTGFQSTDFGFFHDLEFALRICKHHKVGFIDIPTYKLRYHPEQISTLNAPNSAEIAVKLQTHLLKVTEFHGKKDKTYYKLNKLRVDRQLAKLSRAIAIPLMDYTGDDSLAREYLSKSKQYGKPEYFLLLLSYMPHFVRRIVFKIIDIKKVILGRLF